MGSTDTLINSAVLVPLYRDSQNRLRIVLIRRSPGGVHGGQLAFPGGKHEPDDSSLLFTALRETYEEIGLAPDHVDVLSELPPVETKTSGFRIFPFLGSIIPTDWAIDNCEVAELLDITLESLADQLMYGEEVVQHDNWTVPHNIHFYRVGNFKLWGASFRILHPLLPRILADEWSI